jgi:SP family myo-inositol transporter-like MFS transporter 13
MAHSAIEERIAEKAGVENVEYVTESGALDTIEDTKPGSYVWLIAAATAIGGMLFGYDTVRLRISRQPYMLMLTEPQGVISGVLVVIGSSLNGKPLTDGEKEAITSLCAAGALFGAIVAGITSDKYGRKPAIWFASVLFTIGAIVQATSYSIAQMCVGRLLIGLGVGSASMVCSPSTEIICQPFILANSHGRLFHYTSPKSHLPDFVAA